MSPVYLSSLQLVPSGSSPSTFMNFHNDSVSFSIYQFYATSRNTTTIEGWEKDKVARMVRRGKVQEVGQITSEKPRCQTDNVL